MPWPPAQPPRGHARWPVVVMFVITLVAVAAAVAAWLRPVPEVKPASPSTPTFNDRQVANAKSKVCAAYEKIHHASVTNSGRSGGDDPTAQLAVAINERQIYEAGSAYLFTTLANEPAAPPDLAAAALKLANVFQALTLDNLASDPAVPEQNSANETATTIQSLCK
jgi:hypothetical protein